jgi:excisionase family DNA binding protein
MIHRKQVLKTFCTTREAAMMLGVSLRTAQLWAESGLLEAWKTDGGHRRITRASIEQLLNTPSAKNTPLNSSQMRRAGDLARPAPPTPPLPPFNILVVEDDRTLRQLYEIKLRSWPMQPIVACAGDGYEALIRLGVIKPDLLIADLQMPGMDGFRMLRTIKTSPELTSVSIVVVSGLDAEDIALHGGVPDGIPVLPKPIPFDRLLNIAELLVADRQKNRLHDPTHTTDFAIINLPEVNQP